MLRFAPSTSEDMSINDLRIALFNHILSKQLNEELLIRINDTDKENNIEGKDKEIAEILNLFSIDYSRVILQSENVKYHTQMAMKLLLDKKAFNCFCSEEALEQDKQKAKKENQPYSYSGFCETISDETKFNCNAPFVVRMKKPENDIKFIDDIKGECIYKPYEVDSIIILNHAKSPMYNFASSVDDMLYNTTIIFENEDKISDIAKEIHLRESLGYDQKLKYIHIPNIKTSKDSSLPSVKSLIDKGYLPIAIANYLVQLGNKTPKEIFTLEDAIEWFDINNLSNENTKFDINKLNEINKEHLKDIDELRLSKILGYADTDIGKLAKIYINECNTINEIKEKVQSVFNSKSTLEGFKEEFKVIKECLEKAPFIEKLDDLKNHIIKETKLENEKLSTPLRYLLTGRTKGPSLDKIYPLIRNYLGEII